MRSDANPLFSAALPNRFVAIVPAGEAEKIARRIEGAVRDWVREQGRETLRNLLEVAGVVADEDLPCHAQVEAQLAGFPEVHWAVVPWSLAAAGAGDVDTTGIEALLRRLYPEGEGAPGFLGSAAWQILAKPIDLGDSRFFEPNPGVLYPALYDALDHLAVAAKAARPFVQLPQEGFRCTLCGEREWLTLDREQLTRTKGQRGDGKAETLWTRVASSRPAWARRGDHLCALCALKRVWPEMVRDRVREVLPDGAFSERFVVSTHTMAMAPDLEALRTVEGKKLDQLRQTPTYQQASSQRSAALPKRIYDRLTRDGDEERRRFLQGLPTYLDALRDGLDSDDAEQQRQYQEALSRVAGDLRGALGHPPETYYAIVAMDGDHMGAWLAGNDERYRIAYRESWHPQVWSYAKELAVGNERLARYLEARRPPSPARHMAISAALNGFAVELARPIVEDLYKGKLLYAGGDDVLALVAVDDVVEVATLLRLAYGGVLPGGGQVVVHDRVEKDAFWAERFAEASGRYRIGGGFVLDGGDRRDKRPRRLYQVMGERATASCGIAIAHYLTPLARVLKEARAAEQRAKGAGRDRLAITVMKRAGGAIPLTVPWGLKNAASLAETPAGLLLALRDHLARPDVSRRTAYHVYDWIHELPHAADMQDGFASLIKESLVYQFRRQAKEGAKGDAARLGAQLADLALGQGADLAAFIERFLGVAEFLARRGRAPQADDPAKGEVGHG
jgi:CRISPR-associated protein Cmr2